MEVAGCVLADGLAALCGGFSGEAVDVASDLRNQRPASPNWYERRSVKPSALTF